MKKYSIIIIIIVFGYSNLLLSQNTFAKVYDIFHPGNEKQ